MSRGCDSSSNFQQSSAIGEKLFQSTHQLEPVSPSSITCLHPVLLGGVCETCRKQIDDEDANVSTVRLGYIHEELRVSLQELHRLRMSELRNLIRKKKLCLVLDLDHTLLHSVRQGDLSSHEMYLLDSLRDDPSGSLFKTKFSESTTMITKLRPYVRTFLEEASQMFDMYVYTNGGRPYALAMAQLLDPGRRYFDFKVISREDSTEKGSKSLDVVLAPESVVVVVDDKESMWNKHRENVIVIDKYFYFAGKHSSVGVVGGVPSFSESGRDEREIDGGLARVLKKLKCVHRLYYKELDDVRNVLKTVKQLVL